MVQINAPLSGPTTYAQSAQVKWNLAFSNMLTIQGSGNTLLFNLDSGAWVFSGGGGSGITVNSLTIKCNAATASYYTGGVSVNNAATLYLNTVVIDSCGQWYDASALEVYSLSRVVANSITLTSVCYGVQVDNSWFEASAFKYTVIVVLVSLHDSFG